MISSKIELINISYKNLTKELQKFSEIDNNEKNDNLDKELN
jgi:hypothetical protein